MLITDAPWQIFSELKMCPSRTGQTFFRNNIIIYNLYVRIRTCHALFAIIQQWGRVLAYWDTLEAASRKNIHYYEECTKTA